MSQNDLEITRPEPRLRIPPEAEVVFQGVLYTIFHWEQEQFDGSIKTFEGIRRPDTVKIIPVTSDGHIIIAEQEQPGKSKFVGCIGGRMDPDEDILTAAKRELREETGYESEDWVPWLIVRPVDKIDWVMFIFIARNAIKAGDQELEAGERIHLRHLTFDEFLIQASLEGFEDAEVSLEVLRARIDPAKMQDLRRLFFNEE